MNAPKPPRTPPARPRRLALAALLIGALAGGCKGRDGGGILTSRGGDPLFGGVRIPRQDLPIPGRGDALTSRDRRDPLLDSGSDAAPADRTERAGTKTPEGKAAKWNRTPFRPDRTSTTAALAALPTDDGDLSIGRRPGPGADFAASGSGTWTLTEVLGELTRLGAHCGFPEREGDGYVLRGDVPAPGAREGQLRRYEGGGPSPLAAAKSLLEQVRADGVGR